MLALAVLYIPVQVPGMIQDIIQKQSEAFQQLAEKQTALYYFYVWSNYIWLSDVATKGLINLGVEPAPKVPSKKDIEHLFQDRDRIDQWIRLLENIRNGNALTRSVRGFDDDDAVPIKFSADLRPKLLSFQTFWASFLGAPAPFRKEVECWTPELINSLCRSSED